MKSLLAPFALRSLFGLAVAGAALLPASGAFAQTTATPFYFSVVNSTMSGGDPVYSVFDNLTFTNLQVNEGFAGGFTQTVSLASFDANIGVENSSTFQTNSALTSAVLTGTLNGLASGQVLTVNLAQDLSGPTVPFNIYSNFSADLFNPTTPAIGLGQFGLVTGNNVTAVTIGANNAPVPEASTTVSLGLLLALGLGTLAVTRRRTVSVH